MSKSIVREALVQSVTWTSPPVSFQIEPGVHRAEQQFAALGPLACARAHVSRIHLIFVPEK